MIADNIRNYRKKCNMSQDELAEKLGVSRQSVSLWENGQTQPTIENILALSGIFGVSADDLLNNGGEIPAAQTEIPPKKGGKKWIIAVIIILLAIETAVLAIVMANKAKEKDRTPEDETTIAGEDSAGGRSADPKSTEADSTAPESTDAVTTEAPEKFDLFVYCRDFAIDVGVLNGDYVMYQQPSELYGGYENEYFSISYWGDSDMVEFCLHCPLSDTQSENFYLRMRGGYKGKYEYLVSKYHRNDGTSIRSATGYIDPAVFTSKYPLNCTEYYGPTDGQDEFMEESRVGICDLIGLLKNFVKAEGMKCGFEAFGFKNF